MDNQAQNIIEDINQKTLTFLEKLGLEAEHSTKLNEDSGYYEIQLETNSPGLIIGYRGETLAAIQLLLGIIINNNSQTDSWNKILVNVGDYKERRNQTLTQLAENAAQRVIFTGEPYVFDSLSPAERRTVHMALQNNDEVNTTSEGEGRNRQLIISKN